MPPSLTQAAGIRLVVSPESRICPPEWVGVVRLGGWAIATAPSRTAANLVGEAFSGLHLDAVLDPDTVGALLPMAEVLGPATLGYLGKADFRPTPPGPLIDELDAGHPDLRRLERSAGTADAGEAGLADITSPVFVIRERGEVVAACGYRRWPRRIAHLSVLTAPGLRGRGLGRAAASRAVAHALDAGLLPQWRARPVEPRRVAAALDD